MYILASFPGTQKSERSAWYPLFAHARLPKFFRELRNYCDTSPRCTTIIIILLNYQSCYKALFIPQLNKAVSCTVSKVVKTGMCVFLCACEFNLCMSEPWIHARHSCPIYFSAWEYIYIYIYTCVYVYTL